MSKTNLLNYVNEEDQTSKVLVVLSQVISLMDNGDQSFRNNTQAKTLLVFKNGTSMGVKESFATVRKHLEASL